MRKRLAEVVIALAAAAAALIIRGGLDREPSLRVTPLAVAVDVKQGQSTAPHVLMIQNAGVRPLRWTVTPSSTPWLVVVPLAGTNFGIVRLVLDTERLPVEHYHTTVRVDSNRGDVTIPVDVHVIAK